MSPITFIEARFFDPAETRAFLEGRFETYLRRLRGQRRVVPPEHVQDGCDALPDRFWQLKLGDDDCEQIQRRVRRILELRKTASGLEHPKSDDRARLEVLKDGARLVLIFSEHRADELAAALHEDIPWMAALISPT